MNDFTKKELEIAKDGIGWMISEAEMSHNKAEVEKWKCVENKFQFLIDNYDAKVIPVWHCEKCGHVQ